MPFVQNFSVSQTLGEESIVTITDTSTGADAAITQRRVYLITSQGEYLVESGNTGTYTQIFTIITNKTSGGTAVISLWLRKNGVDLVGSSQELPLTNNLSAVFISGNYTLDMLAGDNIQMCWSSADTTTNLTALAPRVGPVRPSGYSAKVTLTRIS